MTHKPLHSTVLVGFMTRSAGLIIDWSKVRKNRQDAYMDVGGRVESGTETENDFSRAKRAVGNLHGRRL